MIHALQPRERLDHYGIESLVVHTCMALIFRGTDLNTSLTVAIKTPDADAESDPVFFQRQAEIGKKLDHPGIMKMVTNSDQSRPYLVTQWLKGRSLRNVLDEAEGRLASTAPSHMKPND